ncbi:MAG: CRISPR-associated protein Csx11 [Blastocatellia bacterium]
MNQLDVLIQPPSRDAIFLAEAIGWLHDYRKCSEEQLRVQAANLTGQGALPRNTLANNHSSLTSVNLQLSIQPASRTLTDLLDDNTWNNDQLGQFLSRCHNTAHFDKQDIERDYGKQNYPGTQISAPFGFEKNVPGNLTSQLWGLPWSLLASYSTNQETNRHLLREEVSNLFSQTIADTRRPINEVDLWNWGLLVGALYKAALAGALLSSSTPAASNLRWRLLGIRVNGLDFLLNVARIPDLLARQELLSDSLDRVCNLLESIYPLGSEVYRDESGSIYVVPDLPDLLERTDGAGASLRTLVLKEFAKGTSKNNPALQLGGEMTPHIELEAKPWWGQDPDWKNKTDPNQHSPLFGQALSNELPAINSLLSPIVASLPKVDEIERAWQSGKVADICAVCGLRPQGPGKKAADRNVCDICEERRADRSKEWTSSQSGKTIWTDEVADTNGRLALIVGQFDLEHWLDGSLLESLFLIAPHDPQNTTGKSVTNKTPSFSRLRRIWETTRRFWQEVQAETLQQLADDRRRLKIHLGSTPKLDPFHVYDLELGVTDLSVVWVPPENGGYLISADNLGYIARQLGAEAAVYNHPATAATFVEDFLREQFTENGCQPVLHNPDAQASRSNPNLLAGIRIAPVEYQQNQYATAIPILAEPRTFMMLMPADKSLQVMRHVKEKYESEMGKVRDRLPIHLGVVYASRRTPIRAVFDAGRAMLDYRTQQQQWTIKPVGRQTQSSAAHFNEAVLLELERGDHRVTWRIPLKMGDGTTEDRWYPYVFLETEGDDSKADAANRRAVKVSWPTENDRTQECWVVHAGDLRDGETIYVTPSTFDFEFLDATSRRFEIYYDVNGRRPRHTRPFYLEDLDRLDELWKRMKGLAVSQRHQVIRTIEAMREEWYGTEQGDQTKDDGVFRQFVADTLAGATWLKGQSWNGIPQEWRDKLIQAGVSGELADLAELHMEILKER